MYSVPCFYFTGKKSRTSGFHLGAGNATIGRQGSSLSFYFFFFLTGAVIQSHLVSCNSLSAY